MLVACIPRSYLCSLSSLLLRVPVVCHLLNDPFRETDATGSRSMQLLMSSHTVPESLFGVCSLPMKIRDMNCQYTHGLFLPWKTLCKLGVLRMRAEKFCPGFQQVIGQKCCGGIFHSLWCLKLSCCLMEIVVFVGYLYLCAFWNSSVSRICNIG